MNIITNDLREFETFYIYIKQLKCKEGAAVIMLKREWQKILKNPWMIIILIGIITIPAIYTSVFLGSMWDPYGDAELHIDPTWNQGIQMYKLQES